MKINKVIPNKILDIEIKSNFAINILYSIIKNMTKVKTKLYPFGYTTRAEKWIAPKLISDKYEFIYVINPVTGTRSILKSFYKDGKEEYKTKFRRLKIKDIKNHKKYTIFTTFRNPFKRLVSAWRKQVLNASTARKIGLISQYRGICPRMSFQKFAERVCDGELDSHWAPQSMLLRERGEKVKINFFIKTENMNKDFKKLCEISKIPHKNLPKIASSKSLKINGPYNKYTKYFINMPYSTTECIKNMYKEDAEKFGYEIGL